jgi:hypothetical protein
MTTKNVTDKEQEVFWLKERVVQLEKNEAIDRYAGYIADAVQHLSAFSSSNRLDAVKNHLNKFAAEITDINNR